MTGGESIIGPREAGLAARGECVPDCGTGHVVTSTGVPSGGGHLGPIDSKRADPRRSAERCGREQDMT